MYANRVRRQFLGNWLQRSGSSLPRIKSGILVRGTEARGLKPRRLPGLGHRREAAFEVGDQIAGILEPDMEA